MEGLAVNVRRREGIAMRWKPRRRERVRERVTVGSAERERDITALAIL
jgi:hypothetical protein